MAHFGPQNLFGWFTDLLTEVDGYWLLYAIAMVDYLPAAVARGFLRTRMTESPRRNIFDMNRSLFTGFTFFLPLPVRGSSVHISFTFSSTMLQCRSKAFTLPSSFLLLRQLMSTWVLFFTDCVSTDSGPVLNSSSSCRASSSGVSSDFGFTRALQRTQYISISPTTRAWC